MFLLLRKGRFLISWTFHVDLVEDYCCSMYWLLVVINYSIVWLSDLQGCVLVSVHAAFIFLIEHLQRRVPMRVPGICLLGSIRNQRLILNGSCPWSVVLL